MFKRIIFVLVLFLLCGCAVADNNMAPIPQPPANVLSVPNQYPTVQAAVNAAVAAGASASNRYKIMISQGSWTITAPIVMYPGIDLVGSGMYATTLTGNFHGAIITPSSDCSIQDIGVIQNNTDVGFNGWTDGAYGYTICRLSTVAGDPINNLAIRRCYLANKNNTAIHLTSNATTGGKYTTNIPIINNMVIDGCIVSAPRFVMVEQASNCQITNNIVTCHDSLEDDDISGDMRTESILSMSTHNQSDTSDFNLIVDNTFDMTYNAIYGSAPMECAFLISGDGNKILNNSVRMQQNYGATDTNLCAIYISMGLTTSASLALSTPAMDDFVLQNVVEGNYIDVGTNSTNDLSGTIVQIIRLYVTRTYDSALLFERNVVHSRWYNASPTTRIQLTVDPGGSTGICTINMRDNILLDWAGNAVTPAMDILGTGASAFVTVNSDVRTGSHALAAGSYTVADTAVDANTRINLQTLTPGGTPGALYVSSKTAGTGFVIESTSSTDTSTVEWTETEY